MRRGIVLLSLVAAFAAAAAVRAGGFPASQHALLRLRDRQDMAGMRAHGWAVLAAVTHANARGDPQFAAWPTLLDTFGEGGARPALGLRRIEHFGTGEPVLQASGKGLLSLVRFNPPAFRHIRANRLYSRTTLDRINAGFGDGTPPARRRIAPFPRDAMAIKLVFAVVRQHGLTPISVWDGPPGDPAAADPPSSWPREVPVDPEGASADPRAVPLARFYHLRLGAGDLDAARRADPDARVGDWLVLVAMHVSTREIPDWVWLTFWWHDRADEGPFVTGRTAAVAGPWRSYLMDVTLSAETPRAPDGGPRIVFNPYLETFAGGRTSNCVSCHQGAVWTASGAPPFLPPTRGRRPDGDPRFRDATRLDFMWSIAEEAR